MTFNPHRPYQYIPVTMVILLGLGLMGGATRLAAAERLPNIIVILADDLGWGDVSASGAKDIRTPNIDRIAREGVTFSNFYANSCVCSPTRASLLTGSFPDRVGVPGVIRDEMPYNSWGYLSPDAVLLPQMLKQRGYHSAIIGKWHLGTAKPNTPNDRGFDFFHGFLGDMMDDYWTHLRHGKNYMRQDRQVIKPEGHATDLFSMWASDYIRSRAKENNPFFLYLAYNAPHSPIQPPPEWLAKVKQREPGISDKRAAMVALIEHMDDGIGKVLATVDQEGIANDTLILFTSDNGGVVSLGADNGPWRSGKLHMYEGGLHVVGYARWPGKIQPSAVTTKPVLSMDIFTTACDIAGIKAPQETDGVSFLAAMLGKEEGAWPERDFYYVRREGGPAYAGKTAEAYWRGDWKLVLDSPFTPMELYNLKQDPGEKSDLAKKEKAVFEELSLALQKQIQRGGSVPWQSKSLISPDEP